VTTGTTHQSVNTAGDLFAPTRWTIVLAAGRERTAQSNAALAELCRTYWYPLYVYVRRHSHTKEDAEDLTQAFFERVLGKNYFAGLDRERGKFRAFLLAALKHFLANEREKARSQKRGGGDVPLTLDWQEADTRYRIEPADRLSPDMLFDRAWVLTLLERVIARLRGELVAAGKTELFAQLKPFLELDSSAVSYAEAAAALQMNEAAVRVTVHRLRRRYRELLRAELTQTLADPQQFDEELRSLFAAFQ
jgi:RNA polymerase sigma-70 factor (ECF subfamily)